MMLIGVVLLLVLIVPTVGGLEAATRGAVAVTGPQFAAAPGYTPDGRTFLTPGLACSFFFIWVFSGFSLPSSIVRVMATESTQVLRRSILLLAVYNALIYIPLIFICIAGRALMPNLQNPDEVIPRLAIFATADIPIGRALSGLILAAPFGAVMATVSSYLLVIASGLVKDLYLRFVRPEAHLREVRLVTYTAMALVGLLAVAANIRPVKYLQALVVFSGSSAAATFVTPVLMTCYWRRATAAGVLASMLAGSATMFGMFMVGWIQRIAEGAVLGGQASVAMTRLYEFLGPDPHTGIAGALRAYFFLGLDPVLWAMAASAAAGIVVSLATTPPAPERVDRYFQPANRL
jgi:SSS family solute:Na+ symporter/sodium/pantothenate symporter